MNDDEVRAMVRDAIATHFGSSYAAATPAPPSDAAPAPHASHGMLPLTRGSDEDGACLIEPAVRCNHCGYCVSLGH
jgi:hypothetical protein